MEYFQVVIWASEAHFCHRLYNYSYNLQGYWVDVSQQKSVLVESGDVYLIQKPQYKLDLFAIVPTESFCKWNKFDYIPGLKLDSKLTFELLNVHKLDKDFVFQDTKLAVYFTFNNKWIKFQAKYATSFVFDPGHDAVISFYLVHNETLMMSHPNGGIELS